LVAAAPAYVKGHSMGEFVFDHAWAQFAEQSLGIAYYPKLVVAVPFTPATGPRLLTVASEAPDPSSQDRLRRAFTTGVARLVERLGLSGAHVLFLPESEAEHAREQEWLHRYGVQFHWRNAGYSSFDEFIERFRSKRRNQIRRERRAILDQGLELVPLTGRDLTSEVMDHVFEFYERNVDRHFWGRQYLCREFFQEVASTMGDRLHVVLARERSSKKPIAGAFNLLGQNALYGRYWGAREERRFLHFNVCFYEGISECIERGLELFEPGAGGEHKLVRGFEPTLTHSVHHIAHPVLRQALWEHVARERSAICAEVEHARNHSVLRPRGH
jgi:predicted N-acyltransferase